MARITTTVYRKSEGLVSAGLVRKGSVVLSVLFHALVLFVFQKAFPIQWVPSPLKTYRVELYRPPVADLKIDSSDEMKLAALEEAQKSENRVPEDTITLDTKDVRYVSYAGMVKARLLEQWQYPEAAKENLLEGALVVLFSLDRRGSLLGIRVLDSSGYRILDEEALRAIRQAAPFPAFPGSVAVSRLHIQARFDYRLKARRRIPPRR